MAVAEAVARGAADGRPGLEAVISRTSGWARLLPAASLDTFAEGPAVAVEATGASSLRTIQRVLNVRLARPESRVADADVTVAAGLPCGPAL